MKDPLKLLSILAYLVACFLPAYNSSNSVSLLGIHALLYGYLGLMVGSLGGFAWLANIFYITAFSLPVRYILASGWLACMALLLSCALFAVKEIPVDEGGTKELVNPGSGAYCWIAAIFLQLIAFLRKPAISI